MPQPKIETVTLILPVAQSEDREVWRRRAAGKLKVEAGRIAEMRLRKHSVDARRREIKVQIVLEIGVDGPLPPEPQREFKAGVVSPEAPRLIIVGCGPAGMFAAFRALQLGWKPIIIERGKDAMKRRFDLAPILREGRVIEDSNYCFGEGGAGTFSDGKLYTRAKKRGPVREVYEILVGHGAPARILIDAHPHVGSNLLPNVVRSMRETIIAKGGEAHFRAKVTTLLRSPDGKRLRGVGTADGREYVGEATILATGHSARDIYQLLQREGLRLEPKTFAVGVRIEHPQPLIDRIQYHLKEGEPRPSLLPAARYTLATKIAGRGVHSFCMCPGGFIVPTATCNDEVVVNGMSLSRRDSPFANSGLVVTVEPEDTQGHHREHGALSGMAFQKELEQRAAEFGGGKQKAPAQRLADFLKGQISCSLPGSSYYPGIVSSPLHEMLPAGIVWRMREGLRGFGKSMPGYLAEEACLIGFETRTSSPLRVPRDAQSLEHPELRGLYPCGEGAGYAGGIVSAALDGMRCAQQACRHWLPIR